MLVFRKSHCPNEPIRCLWPVRQVRLRVPQRNVLSFCLARRSILQWLYAVSTSNIYCEVCGQNGKYSKRRSSIYNQIGLFVKHVICDEAFVYDR